VPARGAPAFETRRSGAGYLRVDAEFAAAAAGLGLPEPGALDALLAGAAASRGRGATALVALPGRDERLHLRPVRHGGWLGGLWRGRLLGLRRPLAELRVTSELAAAGAPVPRPVLVAGRRSGPLWIGAVGTVHEEGASDALAWLACGPGRATLLRAAAAAGSALRRFHDAGGRHADLHVGNLLVRERAGDVEVVVIDLDRARRGSAPEPGRRMAELMRLFRSLLKRGLLDAVGRRGCARFFATYTAGDRELRRALLAHLPRERRRVALHALGYRRLTLRRAPP
jgi:3-deoxy-D-manno-octulosonic acid kinase